MSEFIEVGTENKQEIELTEDECRELLNNIGVNYEGLDPVDIVRKIWEWIKKKIV